MIWFLIIYFSINIILTIWFDSVIFNYKETEGEERYFDTKKFKEEIDSVKRDKLTYFKFLITFILIWSVIFIYSFFNKKI